MLFQSTLSVVLSILTIAAALSLVAVAFGVISRRRYPSIEHACWVIVLLRMVMPPMVPLTIPGFPSVPGVAAPELARAEIASEPIQTEVSTETITSQDDVANFPNPIIATSDEPAHQPLMRPMTPVFVAAPVEMMPAATQRPADAVAVEPAAIASGDTQLTRWNLEVVTAGETSSRPHISSILITVWALGSLAVLFRALISMWRFKRLMNLSEPVSAEIQFAGERVAARVGLTRTPTIRSLGASIPPMVWTRLGRALVVLPRDFSGVVCPTQRDLLLTHEFAHLIRRDHLVRWLELLTLALWWWCPLVWIARSRLRQAEESACDALVVRLWPEQSAQYARVIVDTVAFVAGQPQPGPLATGGLGSLRDVGSRIKEIQAKRASAGTGLAGATGLITLAILACPLMLVGQSVVPGESEAAQATVAVAGDEDEKKDHTDAETGDDAKPQVEADSSQSSDPLAVPPQIDPAFTEYAPDKKKIAFVGSRIRDDGSRQYGLFTYNVANNQITCLIEKGLKTRPAWSPDSTKIAIGNSPGYGNIYPLVIVDVETGKIDETGVQGAGAAWSPDGRYVAVSTGFGNAGSWSAGIPCDGRIGVWDTTTRKLSYVSPAGINEATRDRRFTFMSGGVRPAWSPSGQWIAWQQRTGERRDGEHRDTKTQVWVARRDGERLTRVFDQAKDFQWSDDNDTLIDLDTKTKVAVTDLAAIEADWPTIPTDIKQSREQEKTAAARAMKFDAKQVLKTNRLWQNPQLDGIDSIDFTHRMAPNRLDERFVWRNDGTNLVEVTRRDDEPKSYGVGWSVLKTSDGASYTIANQDSLPRYRSPEAIAKQNSGKKLSAKEALRRDTLRHLSGSRLNFAAIDWGRNPGDFVVSDYKTDDEHRTIELRMKTAAYRRGILNAGAMFETTSWSYIHDVRYDRSVLTIDENDRIIRDVTYSKDKVIADIQLLDWVTSNGGQAPLRIVMSFPENNKFVVDQRFRVTDEGLWILKSGTSKFAESPAQTEEIIDLKINVSTDLLEQRLMKAKKLQRELESADDDAIKIAITGLTPLELGATHQFQSPSKDAGPSSLTFLPHDASGRDGGWPKSVMCAELRYSQGKTTRASDPNLMLALYDDNKLPQYVVTIPESAVSMSGREASDVIGELLERHQLWIRSSQDPLPTTSYTFRVEDRETKIELPSKKPSFARGLTLTLGLDHVHFAPQNWKMPVAFTADWNGRAVKVIGLTGPSFKQEFGSGIDGTYIGGYSSTGGTSMLLVVDAATGFPLVERTAFMEFQFRDYTEAAPGQFVPLRVLCKTATHEMDLRFQALNGQLWLLDHKVQPESGSAAGISVVKIDGNPPITRLQSNTPDGDGSVPWFPWNQLTDRKSEQSSDQLSASLAAVVEPWTHPSWDVLRGLSVESEPDGGRVVRIELNPWPYVGDPKYWTLTSMAKGTAKPLLCPESLTGEAIAVRAYRIDQAILDPRLNESRATDAIRVSAVTDSARIKSFRVEREPNLLATLTPEIVSTSYNTDQQIRVTAVMVNDSGVAVSGGFATDSFRTLSEPMVSSDARVVLLNSDSFTGSSVLIGSRAGVTGMPMGSQWGRMDRSEPEFESKELLSSRFAAVRLAGLRQLYQQQWRYVTRRYERLAQGRDDRRAMQALAPHRGALSYILSGREGDSDESLAIACRLAGYSQIREFIEPLQALLKHESSSVQDAAVIGLALLGKKDSARLDQLAEKSKSTNSDHPLESKLATEIGWAIR